jgi:hypothetical protein
MSDLFIYSSCQLKVVDLWKISINTRSANADGIKKELHGNPHIVIAKVTAGSKRKGKVIVGENSYKRSFF